MLVTESEDMDNACGSVVDYAFKKCPIPHELCIHATQIRPL